MVKKTVCMRLLTTLFVILALLGGAVQSQTADLPPLTDPGPYGVRKAEMTFVDSSRDDWTLDTHIWYPADKTQGTPANPNSPLLKDAPPDRSGAPYPLIVYSHGWRSGWAEWMAGKVLLASHGFIVIAISHHDTDPPSHEFVDRPLDIVTVLDGLATLTEGDLAGMIDTNNVGLMGYSQGAQAAFQMLGLLSDPIHFTDWCSENPTVFECEFIPLEQAAAYRTQLGLEDTPNGRWQPFGDARIHAVSAIAPRGFPLTTETMLAAVTTPIMMFQGTKDSYEDNALRTYTHLGTEDRYLISLVNAEHYVLGTWDDEILHFSTAFFGYYLQGNDDFVPYLTAEHAANWEHIVWGPYTNE